jgi:hypothetical protein
LKYIEIADANADFISELEVQPPWPHLPQNALGISHGTRGTGRGNPMDPESGQFSACEDGMM